MGNNNQTSLQGIYSLLRGQVFAMPLIAIIAGGIWHLYAEPRVKDSIKEEMNKEVKPMKGKVDTLVDSVKSLKNELKEIKFQQHQQFFLMKKMAGKKAVEEMEEETEIFRPVR